REQNCGTEPRRPRFPAESRPRLALYQYQQRGRTSEPGKRDRRQLPVPVLRGMDQKRDVASEGRCRERLLARNHAGGDWERGQRPALMEGAACENSRTAPLGPPRRTSAIAPAQITTIATASTTRRDIRGRVSPRAAIPPAASASQAPRLYVK